MVKRICEKEKSIDAWAYFAIDFSLSLADNEIMDVTQEHKTKIEEQILKAVIIALENGALSQEEPPKISDFVLERIDKVSTHEELVGFLAELSGTWPIFANITLIEKGETAQQEANEVAKNVSTLAQSGNIEEALNLAKSATQS